MKFSIDLDGTLLANQDFFREFMHLMQDAKNEVGILTGWQHESKDKCFELLEELGFPKPDFFLGRTEEYMPKNGAVYKLDMIAEHNIDYHFDDFDFNNPETIEIFNNADFKLRQKVVHFPHKGVRIESK